MRIGGCVVQQAFTTEAASVLKKSLSHAKRRGHAQVTPLHVAATLVCSSSTREQPTTTTTSLLRTACLNSHPLHPSSHPLQCRALELCFNVALNRLPTIIPSPPPSPSPSPSPFPSPSLSNALVAALKRAQAHQRRSCIEQQHNQQQPILAVKVELEQLVISILDDPSVSRVMREAGFSSTFIKNNLERLEEDSSSSSHNPNQRGFWRTHLLKPGLERSPRLVLSQKEDVKVVLDVLLGKNKKRTNAVVVGDSITYSEGVVAELMLKVETGDVPEELRSVQFIELFFSSVQLKFMSGSDVEMKVSELRSKVSSLTSERRSVIIYLGDLKWAVADDGYLDGGSKYRAVNHVIAELGRLQNDWSFFGGCSNRVWFVATASFHTYMRCQLKQPSSFSSLEIQWRLQPASVPSSGGLSLSLHLPNSSHETKDTGVVELKLQVDEGEVVDLKRKPKQPLPHNKPKVSRKTTSNILDLNIKAAIDDDDNHPEKEEDEESWKIVK